MIVNRAAFVRGLKNKLFSDKIRRKILALRRKKL